MTAHWSRARPTSCEPGSGLVAEGYVKSLWARIKAYLRRFQEYEPQHICVYEFPDGGRIVHSAIDSEDIERRIRLAAILVRAKIVENWAREGRRVMKVHARNAMNAQTFRIVCGLPANIDNA